MKDPLYLLDGYSLIYRSYFAFIRNPLFNPAGKNTQAVFGFFRTLLALFEEKAPKYFAVIMDSQIPTFRHNLYKEYKATREKTPQDLHDQIPVIEEICTAIGIPWIRKNGYEADDIIASYSALCQKEERPCYIITGDKDLLQLVRGATRILKPDKGAYQELGPAEVKALWGVRPDQIVDYLSLIGDQADNVPGVRGIGPKTAEKLLNRYETLEGVYGAIEEITGSEKKKLEEGENSAFLSRDLIVLKEDLTELPLPGSFSVSSLSADKGIALFEREGAKSLISQLLKLAPAAPKASSGISTDKTGPPAEDIQGELFPGRAETSPGSYETISSPEELKKAVRKIKEAKAFSFDVETDSLDEMQAEPVGFSVSIREGHAWYIPLAAGGGRVLNNEAVKPFLEDLLTDPSLFGIGQNCKYDYKVVKRWGIRQTNIAFDTMVAAWLLDAQGASYGMDKLAEDYLNYKTIHFSDIVPKGGSFRDVPLDSAARYSGEDADITFRLFKLFDEMLKSRGLYDLFRNLEMPLVTLLAEMELAGIILKPEGLRKYSGELAEILSGIQEKIYKECGKVFNINSTKQLQEVLFTDRKLTPAKKTKTGFSTDLQVLEELAAEDIVPELVLKHRMLSKLKSTYVDALPELINPETGRIHTRFVQTGTATGRLSSRDPNLQNIPIRDEEGRRIRSFFVPAKGSIFVSADYSQIELVVLAHLSGDPALKDAFVSGEDVHRRTASLIFDIPAEMVSAEQRRIAKTINFGVMYGMSSFRLSRELKIPRKDAQSFIDAYFTRYRGIRAYMDRVVKDAEKTGKASTLLGREREIPGIRSRNKTEKMGAERMAVNTGIQGTAADIVKTAMLRITSKMKSQGLSARLILQVHDELIFEVPFAEEERLVSLVKEEMEKAVTLSVPLRVNIEKGESWGDIHI